MEPQLTFKKLIGFGNIEGQLFEINLATLLFLRGLNSGLDFQMATNLEGAGAMDDIVFRFKPSTEPDTWTTVYVQLKYKANRPVQRALLTSPKGDFSMKKYFESSQEIKNPMSPTERGSLLDGSFEKSVFVIFTNATGAKSLGHKRYWPFCQAIDFVWCGLGRVFSFEDDEEIRDCLGGSEEEGTAFLDRFHLVCGQPNASGLEGAIKMELQKVDAKIIQGIDMEIIFDFFLRRMRVWWDKSNEILHRGNDLLRSSVLEIISLQTVKRYALDLVFEEASLKEMRDSLKGDCKVSLVKSSESSCRLSLTKLCQAFGGQSLMLDCENLLANKEALLLQWRKEEVKSLIICTNAWDSLHQEDYCRVVNELLEIPNSLPIVFLTNDETDVFGALTVALQVSITSCDDQFTFSQLNEASQKQVLDKELSFQGHSTTLSTLLQGSLESADRVLDARSVVEILVSEGILSLGSAFDDGIGHYVDRHLEQATMVKTSVLQDGAPRDSVTVQVMQCEEASVDLGLENVSVIESSKFPRVSAATSRSGILYKAVGFLSSISDSKSFRNLNTGQTVCKLSKSLLVADKDDCEFFTGPQLALGLFKCNSVGLRFGQPDAVTALWVRSTKHSSPGGFLFVSDKSNENDVQKLSRFYQSKHLLSLKDGQLRWIESHGDIESIRPHIDEDQASTFSPEKVTDVEDRLVLLCAEPGMGKSTLMAWLAKNSKVAHPHYFVFSMALSDHFPLFAQDKHKDPLEFISIANKIESHLYRSLLKYALEVTGNVVVLFDGYDEIAPKYVEQSCDLLSSLMKKTKTCKIWITSRNSIKTILETRIRKFAVKLRKFDETDQIIFLKRFWATKPGISEMQLDDFIKRLVEKASQIDSDKVKDLMGIPLQTQIMAEVFESHVTDSTGKSNLPDNLDLLVLLEQFVEKKCQVYVQAKLNISPDSPMYEAQLKISRKTYFDIHSKAGLILILGDDISKIPQTKSIVKKSLKIFEKIKLGEVKTGFIDSIVNGKPRFTHRVFAEYFVAKWISKNFSDYQELVESKMFTPDFSVVRDIFDRILAKGCDLHTAVINEDPEQVRTLLDREDIDVNAIDGGGRTALHLAASVGTKKDSKENQRNCEILDLLIAKTINFDQVDEVLDASPLKYADITRSYVAIDKFNPCSKNKEQFPLVLNDLSDRDMLDAVLNSDLHNLLGFCLDNGLQVTQSLDNNNNTPLHLACRLKSPKAVQVLLETLDEADRAQAVSSQNNDGYSVLISGALGGCMECVELIVNAGGKLTQVSDDGGTPLMAAAQEGHEEVVSYLLNNFNADTEATSKQDYINMVDKMGFTAIHVAAWKGHPRVISILMGHGGDPPNRGVNNSTPLHLAAKLKHPNAVRVLLEVLEEVDRADAVNLQDTYGNSVLMCAAWGGCVECVELIVQAGGKLNQVNVKEITPLMAAAEEGHQEIVNYLLNKFNAELEGISKHDYINMKQKIGFNAIHVAAWKGHSQVINDLISHGGDPQIQTHNKSDALHLAAKLKHPGAVHVLLEALDEADRAKAVNTRNDYSNTVLMCGAFGGCVECVELLLKAGGNITEVSDDGRTSLMTAAQEGHLEVVSYLLNNFNAERVGMSKEDYINIKHKLGWSAIHFSAWKGHASIITILIDQGGDPRSLTHDKATPLHLASELKHPKSLSVLLEALDEADRADAISLQDSDGDSVLMSGAIGGCVECVELIVKAGGKMTQVNVDGRTPLMAAALEGHHEVVSYLLNSFNAETELMSQKEYINMAEKAGWTAIHFSSGAGHSNVISYLIEQGGNPQIRDHFNSSPLHVAALSKRPNAVRVLLEALDEADRAEAVNSPDNDGTSVLMCAAWGGCVECVGLIVKAGGRLTQVNDDGYTPLIAAVRKSHLEIVEYLLTEFDSEREEVTKLAYIKMADKKGDTALQLASPECREILQGYLTGHVD